MEGQRYSTLSKNNFVRTFQIWTNDLVLPGVSTPDKFIKILVPATVLFCVISGGLSARQNPANHYVLSIPGLILVKTSNRQSPSVPVRAMASLFWEVPPLGASNVIGSAWLCAPALRTDNLRAKARPRSSPLNNALHRASGTTKDKATTTPTGSIFKERMHKIEEQTRRGGRPQPFKSDKVIPHPAE